MAEEEIKKLNAKIAELEKMMYGLEESFHSLRPSLEVIQAAYDIIKTTEIHRSKEQKIMKMLEYVLGEYKE